jgi:DNA-binding protein H-NS
MDRRGFESLSTEALWKLFEELQAEIAKRLIAEKSELEQQLKRLNTNHMGSAHGPVERQTRPYPPVKPKYQNPENKSETWAGRGLTPRWLATRIKQGAKLEDFSIEKAESRKRKRR